MSLTKEQSIKRAKTDLAKRLNTSENQVAERSVADAEFEDMSLGAPVSGEMSAQMISSGWRIQLESGGKNYEYRADANQLRLFQFNGANFVVE